MFEYEQKLHDETLYTDQIELSFLVKAVLEENVEEMGKILSLTTDFLLNVSDKYGNTPLHIAVIKNRLKSVNFLLAQDGVLIDTKNVIEQTPLHSACIKNDVEVCRSLVDAGAGVNSVDWAGNAPLHHCLKSPEITHLLIKNGADIDKLNISGETPVQGAVSKGNLETLCMLLYYNCDTSQRVDRGNTPFINALNLKNIEMQSVLLEYIEDFTINNVYSDNILTLAVRVKSPYAEEIVLKGADIEFHSLHVSILTDNIDMFKLMWKRLPKTFNLDELILTIFLFVSDMPEDLILDCFDFILEYSDESRLKDLADSFNYIQFKRNFRSSIFMKTVGYYRRSLESLTKFFFVLLQYNYNIFLTDIYEVFVYFGYCDLFKYFLHMDYSIGDFEDEPLYIRWIIPKYILDIKSDLKEICSKWYLEVRTMKYKTSKERNKYSSHIRTALRGIEIFKNASTDVETEMSFEDCCHIKSAIGSLEYSVDYSLIQLLSEHFEGDTEFLIIRDKLPTIPSLLQFSRDTLRKYIVAKFNFQRPSQLYTYINAIEIPKIYKQILTLERRIYNFNL